MNALIGRQSEFDAIVRALDQSINGRGSVVLISGEAGIGKTSLIRDLLAAAESRMATVLSGRTSEASWAPPYAAWMEALDPLIQGDDEPTTRPDFPSNGSNLSELPADETRLQLHDATVRLVRTEARRKPVVIALDDIHWAGKPALELARHLAFASDRERVLLILAFRDAGAAPHLPLGELIANLRRESTTTEIHLSGLDRDHLQALLRCATGDEVSNENSERIRAETGGNPLFAIELGRHLLVGGDRSRVFPDSQPAEEPIDTIPVSVRQSIAQRLNQLSKTAQEAVSMSAIFPSGVEVSTLQQLGGELDSALIDALDEAATAGFLQPSKRGGDWYEFGHSIVRNALIANWNPARLVRTQRRAAEIIASTSVAEPGDRAGEIAALFYASRSLPGWEAGAPYALLAADLAWRSSDAAQTATLLEMARALCDPQRRSEQYAEILRRHAIAKAESLHAEEGAEIGWSAIESMESHQAPTEEIASFTALLAVALKNRAGAEASVWRPFLVYGLEATKAKRDLAWARLNFIAEPVEPVSRSGVRAGIWTGFDEEAIRIARSSGTEVDQARSYESFDSRTAVETDALVGLARGWRNPQAKMHALTVAANDWQYRHGTFSDAEAVWQEINALGEKFQAVAWQAQAANQLTLLHIAAGRFDQARESEAHANELLSRLGPGRRPDLYSAEMNTARALYLGGEFDQIGDYWIRFADDPSLAPGDAGTLLAPFFAAVGAYALAEAGDHARVAATLAVLTPILEKLSIDAPNQNGAVAFAAAAIWKIGDAKLASPYRMQVTRMLEAGSRDYPQTSLHLTLARMAALLDRQSEASDAFQLARSTLDQSGQRPLRGIVDFDQATWLMSRSQPDYSAAAALAKSAMQQFSELGMGFWASRADALIQEIERRAGPPTYPAGLTEREVDVLKLVAQGQSDKEISDSLFISPRTVNAHMRNMFSKTGAANRTDLSVWAVAQGLVSRSSGDSVGA